MIRVKVIMCGDVGRIKETIEDNTFMLKLKDLHDLVKSSNIIIIGKDGILSELLTTGATVDKRPDWLRCPETLTVTNDTEQITKVKNKKSNTKYTKIVYNKSAKYRPSNNSCRFKNYHR